MEQNIFENENIQYSLPDSVFKLCAKICNSPSDLKISIGTTAFTVAFNVCLPDG